MVNIADTFFIYLSKKKIELKARFNIPNALKISVFYLVIGFLWIFYSDKALNNLNIQNQQTLFLIQTYKGFFYVTITSILLYLLILGNEKKILHNASQYQKMFEFNPNPMLFVEPENGTIKLVNAATEALYGYLKSDFVKMKLSDFHAPENEISVAEILKMPQKVRILNQIHYHKSGKKMFVEMVTGDIIVNDIKTKLILIKDITAEYNFKSERNKLIDELVLKNKNLENFAYIASHKLRVPVANIIGLIQLMKKEKNEGSANDFINYFSESAENLDNITQELTHILEEKHD